MKALSNEIEHIRRALPISAYPRRQLQAFLSTRRAPKGPISKLSILDIFRGDGASGFMCRFFISGDNSAKGFVAPLSQIALDRRSSPVLRSRRSFVLVLCELV